MIVYPEISAYCYELVLFGNYHLLWPRQQRSSAVVGSPLVPLVQARPRKLIT
jgi:hypothetical protein